MLIILPNNRLRMKKQLILSILLNMWFKKKFAPPEIDVKLLPWTCPVFVNQSCIWLDVSSCRLYCFRFACHWNKLYVTSRQCLLGQEVLTKAASWSRSAQVCCGFVWVIGWVLCKVGSALCARALPRVHVVYGVVVVVPENSGSYIDCLIVNL